MRDHVRRRGVSAGRMFVSVALARVPGVRPAAVAVATRDRDWWTPPVVYVGSVALTVTMLASFVRPFVS